MKYLSAVFMMLWLAGQIDAQAMLKGQVLSKQSQEKVELASVLLLDGQDTSKILQLTVADLNGHFVFDTIAYGNYFLLVEHLSFLPAREGIAIDSLVNSITILLEPDTMSLSEVTVTASKSKWYSDKTDYVIATSDRKMKVNALELLETIPEIEVDIVRRTVKTIARGKVKLLLNGKNASADDIIALSKKNIVRLDYYDMPQMRYSMQGFESVIDVITKDVVRGWKMGLALENGFTTAYGRDNISFGMNSGAFYADLKYGYAYQHRKRWIVDETISYEVNDTLYQRTKKGVSGQDALEMHSPVVGVGLFKRNNYDIYLKYAASPYHSENDLAQEVIFNSSALSEKRFLRKQSDYQRKHRAVDLYLSKKIKGRNDLIANFLYSQYENNSMSESIEKDELDSVTLSLPYSSKSDKWTLISELYYTQVFKKWKLNIGGKSTLSGLDLLDVSGRNKERIASHFGFAEAIGDVNKFTYKLSLGGVGNYFSEEQENQGFRQVDFYPKASLKYKINKAGYWLLFYDFRSINPALSQLTTTKIKIDERLWRTGEPSLRPYGVHRSYLTFFSKPKNISYLVRGIYSRIFRGVYFDYLQEGGIILQKPVASDFVDNYALAFSIRGEFFDKKLNLRCTSQIQKSKIEKDGESWSKNYFYGAISGTYKYDDFLFKLSLATPYKGLSGKIEYLNTETSTLSVFWSKPSYSIGLNYSYLFSDAWGFSSKTVFESLVEQSSDTRAFDVAKMLTLSINYHFSKGKLPQIGRKKLSNKDTDSGVLE